MGLLLFDAFDVEDEVEPDADFVAATAGRKVSHQFGGGPRAFFPKDPAEVDWVNFDFSASLATVADDIESIAVFVSAGDSRLSLDEKAFEAGVVSCRWQGGRRGVTYGVTARIDTEDGRRWELTGSVLVTDN